MGSWYNEEVMRLIGYTQTFQILYALILCIFILLYGLNVYKYGIQSITNKVYESLQHAVMCVSLFATFVSIGPIAYDGIFCILMVFQILQFLIYGFISFILIQFSGGKLKLACVPIDLQSKERGIYIFKFIMVLSNALLALWIHYSINIACYCIDRNYYLRMRRNRAQQNCIDIIFGENFLLVTFHVFAAVIELILIPSIFLIRHKKIKQSIVYNQITDERQNVYYDVESEGI